MLALIMAGALAACSAETPDGADGTAESTMAETGTSDETTADMEPAASSPTLEDLVVGDQRPDGHADRNQYRNPVETLEFFGIEPDMTVVEVWPGGGWYAHILAPYLEQGGGDYIAAGFEIGDSENARRSFENFQSAMAGYGDVDFTVLSAGSDGIAPAGSADMVLTFRNVHNWMGGGFADKAFADFYAALKPGGTLGVVEHRLPEDREQFGEGGYVKQSAVIAMAERAGFQFVEASEINANPADTADHPFGVWTLPPNNRSSNYGEEPDPEFDSSKYMEIGESDRMTLKFTKPVTADGAMLE
ncbi:methyltransferase [Aquisalinus flavus]|uniref:Methyltransferase n=1 Tax=Aquisalinus flavus TaxID=1526572 RepID=A0A8J2V3B3_9PROT|nr:methyltransferase [Aquisalinus flavus]